MKICPLISLASILEDKDLLVRETDVETPAAPAKESAESDGLFINPEAKAKPDGALLDEIAPTIPARFVAKSYRGQVECLGELCRFHNDEVNECRFEQAIVSAAAGAPAAPAGSAEEIARAIAGQPPVDDAVRPLIAALEERHGARFDDLARKFESGLAELSATIRGIVEERDKSLEAFSLTLDAHNEEIGRRIEAGSESVQSLRADVAAWKGDLERNVGGLEASVTESRRVVEELSKSHAGIVQVVENQKKSLAEEERKRAAAEARRINNAGVMAYHNGQYEKALELFRSAIAMEPSLTEAYNNLGLTYTEMNDEKKAVEAFKKAIELSPELAAAYNNLGYVFYRLGSFQEAIEMYNEAIGRSARNGSAYTNLGNAYYKLNRTDDAIEAWKKALAIDPANEKAKRNLKRFHAEVK